MKSKKPLFGALIIGFPILVALITHLIWQTNRESGLTGRCGFDGTIIRPLYEVRVTFRDGSIKRFCSIVCAKNGIKSSSIEVDSITVVDESTGTTINAKQAYFIESEVITIPHVKERIHVFATREGAMSHAQQWAGKLVENPFLSSKKERNPMHLTK